MKVLNSEEYFEFIKELDKDYLEITPTLVDSMLQELDLLVDNILMQLLNRKVTYHERKTLKIKGNQFRTKLINLNFQKKTLGTIKFQKVNDKIEIKFTPESEYDSLHITVYQNGEIIFIPAD